jgi:hypothetical protein
LVLGFTGSLVTLVLWFSGSLVTLVLWLLWFSGSLVTLVLWFSGYFGSLVLGLLGLSGSLFSGNFLYGFPDFGCGFDFLGLDMAAFKSIEEIEAWKLARALSREIYQLIQSGTFARDFPLKDQISRSSGSIMDNIAEGF